MHGQDGIGTGLENNVKKLKKMYLRMPYQGFLMLSNTLFLERKIKKK